MANALITYADAPATLLSEYIDDNDTTMVVADASGFTSTGVIVISRANAFEIISYTSKDDRHLYGLVRGDFSSGAIAHEQGEKIELTTWTPSLSETEKVAIESSAPDLAVTKLAPTVSQSITAGYSSYVVGPYEIVTGTTLEIGVGACLEIG